MSYGGPLYTVQYISMLLKWQLKYVTVTHQEKHAVCGLMEGKQK